MLNMTRQTSNRYNEAFFRISLRSSMSVVVWHLKSIMQTTKMTKIPSSSSDWSAFVVDDRFQRKLRNGLFERDLRLTFADDDWLRDKDESPFCGVDGSDDKALSSAEVWVSSIRHLFFFIQNGILWIEHSQEFSHASNGLS